MTSILLKRRVVTDVEIRIDGQDLADMFWEMDSTEQSKFFNSLGAQSHFVSKLQSITDDEELSESGRLCMGRIGEYSQPYTHEKPLQPVDPLLNDDIQF